MITGSHNPPEYNGFKMVINEKTLASDDIQNLYQIILDSSYLNGEGDKKSLSIKSQYLDEDIQLGEAKKTYEGYHRLW